MYLLFLSNVLAKCVEVIGFRRLFSTGSGGRVLYGSYRGTVGFVRGLSFAYGGGKGGCGGAEGFFRGLGGRREGSRSPRKELGELGDCPRFVGYNLSSFF